MTFLNRVTVAMTLLALPLLASPAKAALADGLYLIQFSDYQIELTNTPTDLLSLAGQVTIEAGTTSNFFAGTTSFGGAFYDIVGSADTDASGVSMFSATLSAALPVGPTFSGSPTIAFFNDGTFRCGGLTIATVGEQCLTTSDGSGSIAPTVGNYALVLAPNQPTEEKDKEKGKDNEPSDVSAVPLPGALPLVLAGLAAFGAVGARRRSRGKPVPARS